MRSVPASTLSDLLLPTGLRYRAISVAVSTPRETYPEGAPIPITITMRNALPVPITITTASPLLWTWDVDGAAEASRVPLRDPPDEPGTFRFDRGERKQFRRRWPQAFKVSGSEWASADPGEYTIGAGVNVPDADEKGLYDETTVTIAAE